MDKFLQRHKLPKLIQEEIENSSTPTKEIEFIGKNLTKKAPSSDSFTVEILPNN